MDGWDHGTARREEKHTRRRGTKDHNEPQQEEAEAGREAGRGLCGRGAVQGPALQQQESAREKPPEKDRGRGAWWVASC